ncbi:MAG: hypothetical protein JJU29_23760 [Verrucomicrobia bacterium]|nr:hypothetical protein [Verrucomicrobiota bacterium]
MKVFPRICCISLSILFLGCPTIRHPASTVPPGSPFGDTPEGTVRHVHSGMEFPAEKAKFTRTGVRQYDARGLNVSAAYDFFSPRIAATVFIYPTPPVRSIGSPPAVIEAARGRIAEGVFRGAMGEITQAHGDAELLEEREIPASDDGFDRPGYFARFTYTANFAGRRQTVESLLYTFSFVDDRWTVKYRITYPAKSDATNAVERFLGF